MKLARNTEAQKKEEELGIRPLTARSVVLSTLLGLEPPVLSAARLVATARLFGLSAGSARVALSRLVAAGDIVVEDGRYRLTGRLLERQHRQSSGRHPPRRRWRGTWHLLVVTADRRAAAERSELRTVLTGARLAPWRDGLWTRPDNLERPVLPDTLDRQCSWLAARPDDDPASLAAELWDLPGWAARAHRLIEVLAATRPPLDAGDTAALAPGFVRSAAVLRHLTADPLLPAELLPADWPGDELRRAYDGWDAAYRAVLADWHRAGATVMP